MRSDLRLHGTPVRTLTWRASVRRRAAALIVVGLVMVSGCTGDDPTGLQAIAEEASAERHDGGFAVVVTDGDGNREAGVAGTLADGSPMDADGTWIIGSVSKAFVAATAMQLIDEGVLSLDDEAADHVEHDFVPATATVFDLLHHSSGIPDYVQDPQWVETMRACPDRVPHPYDHVPTEPDFTPGTEWAYSNTNYVLVGEVIEAVTGNPVHEEIRSRVIEPLDLADTYLLDVEDGRPPMAASQDFFDTGPGPVADCDMKPAPGPALVDSRIVSSVSDLDRFYRALFGGELVSGQSLDLMMRQTDLAAESGHGLGIIHLLDPPVDGVDIYANGGGVVGYQTLLLIDVQSMTTIVAVSPNGFGFERQQDAILRWAFPE